MSRPTPPSPNEVEPIVELVRTQTAEYLGGVADRPVRVPETETVAARFSGPLPDDGIGAIDAVQELWSGLDGAIHTVGPKFFHFVTGGSTPAALGGDWTASALDQNPAAWVESPLAGQIEGVALEWLKELFSIPSSWGGVLTTGATMANFTALACARRWWGMQHGVDVDEDGVGSLPAVPVLGSGYVHASDVKALAMLGIGRSNVQKLARDGVGRLDAESLEGALRALGGAPSIVIVSAGEVNAGDFDPLPLMADLAERYGAWLHVDGAFGLFANLSERTRHLVEGLERANSAIADGHKWLNVPYESGFAFVRDRSLQPGVFGSGAAYLPDLDDPYPQWGYLGPEMSRRARSFAVWATLRAYGRSGYQAIVERHLAQAERLAGRIDASPDLERLADVGLNIVCFRFRPDGVAEDRLDDLNARVGAAVLADGRVAFGTTRFDGKLAFRPALSNWRTRDEDVDLIVDVTRELGAGLLTGG